MVKMTTIKTSLVVASINERDIFQVHVSNAFLHGDLEEEAYMTMPLEYKGFCQVQHVATSASKGKAIYRLLKSLYGLKQALEQWFEKLFNALLNFINPKLIILCSQKKWSVFYYFVDLCE